MYLLKLAFRPWKLAPFSQIFSSMAVGVLLLMIALLYWIQKGLDPVLSRLEHEQVITAYLSPFDPNGQLDQAKIVDSIRIAVGAHAERAEIDLVEGTEFIEELRSSYPDLASQLEGLGPEMSTIVPRYVSVSGFLENTALERIRAVPGVEGAETSKDRYKTILTAFTAVRWVARLLSAGVALALLTGLIHLSRTNVHFHRESIGLLRLWGASEWQLRLPAMISALMAGTAGGVIAGAGWLLSAGWLSSQVQALSPVLAGMGAASPMLAPILLATGIMAGALAGSVRA